MKGWYTIKAASDGTSANILERDCALTPSAVSRVQDVIDDLRDEMARKVAESQSEDGWPAHQV